MKSPISFYVNEAGIFFKKNAHLNLKLNFSFYKRFSSEKRGEIERTGHIVVEYVDIFFLLSLVTIFKLIFQL